GTGKETARLTGVKGTATALAFSPDGKILAIGDNRGTIQLWDIGERKKVAQWTEKGETIASLAFSPDGKWFAWSFGWRARVSERSTGKIVATYTAERDVHPCFCTIAFTSDVEKLVLGSNQGYACIRLWNWKDGNETRELAGGSFNHLAVTRGNM